MNDCHEIARYFSPSARLAAARCTYAAAADDPYGPPRTETGYCPIGVMVEVDMPGSLPPEIGDPPACVVQTIFDRCGRGFIEGPAQGFIHDWDNNGITDLYEALGVEREAPP